MGHRHKKRCSLFKRYPVALFYRKLLEAFDLDGFLPQVAFLLREAVPEIDAAVVYLYDNAGKRLVPVSACGCELEDVREVHFETETSLVGKAFSRGRPFLQREQEAAKVLAQYFKPASCAHFRPGQIVSLFCVPMDLSDGTRFGCLLFFSAAKNNFSPRCAAFLKRAAKILGLFIYKAQTLKQSQEKKYSSLVCTLSHELRTPLTCIKGYATTLLSREGQWSRDEEQEFLKIIDAEADTMKELINDLMDSSMIESGLLSVHKEPVLLPRIISKAVDDARLRTTKHKFVVSIPRDFPVIEADPVRTRQVLDNLLENAIKYSPGGGLIVVQCRIDRGEVILSVADEGMGIAPEHLNRLFEKFYRVKSDLAGTGLGLPVACEIVEKQGGRIWAKSTPGKGSTFYFTLPLTPMDQVPEEEECPVEETNHPGC